MAMYQVATTAQQNKNNLQYTLTYTLITASRGCTLICRIEGFNILWWLHSLIFVGW